MSLRLSVFCALAISLSACATVDITDMASGSQNKADVVSQESNVVIRSTQSLQDRFLAEGWGQTTTPQRLQSAANILLRGMKKAEAAIRDTKVDTSNPSTDIILLRADILEASKEVAQTVKAAEVYFDMVETPTDLKAELKGLEKALTVSRRAEVWFEKSLAKFEDIDVEAEMASYAASVDRLRDSTNLYGDHVREQARQLGAPAS